VKREVETIRRTRATLDAATRERLSRILRDIFGHAPSGRVILNANAGGVLHAELEERQTPAAKT
jgi:hypothetical protein